MKRQLFKYRRPESSKLFFDLDTLVCTSSLRSHNFKKVAILTGFTHTVCVCASRILNGLTQKIQTVCKIVFQVNNLTRKKRRNIFVWRISCPFPIPNCKLLSFSKGGGGTKRLAHAIVYQQKQG